GTDGDRPQLRPRGAARRGDADGLRPAPARIRPGATDRPRRGSGLGRRRRRPRGSGGPPSLPVTFRLRNVLLLTLTQATSSTSVTLVAAVGSLAGYALASNKALATLPSTMAVIGTALSTIPASLLMQRVGRPLGFVVGALFATAGGLISVAAMAHGQFWLLTAAALLLGV